jgi:hypothetical protein
MAVDQRHKDKKWSLPTDSDGRIGSWDHVKIAVLMDIRDELQTLNRLLGCPNFTGIPETLRQIRRKIPTRRGRTK